MTSVNKLIGHRLGWHFELKKWEDTAPGFGRPQALINPMVDGCDLFVGLLWERWGQPSGSHSSGFEEEFERALDRRKRTGEPAIWLVFKEVGSDKLKDPGEQLKKVIEFRSSQETLQEVLFKNVRDSDDWRNNLQLWLLDYILATTHPAETSLQGPVSVFPAFGGPDISSLISTQAAGTQREIPKQIEALSRLLDQSLQTGAFGFANDPKGTIQEFEVARLFLLSATLIFQRYTREVLGTHEVNLLYKHRKRLEAAPAEEFQLMRAIVDGPGETNPGWFWFRDMADEAIPGVLFGLAERDGSEGVRIGALGLLTTGRISLPQTEWQSLPLGDDSLRIREAVFRYVGSMGDERTLPLLDTIPSEGDPILSSYIEDAKLEILMGLDPDGTFSEVVTKDKYLSDGQVELLAKHFSGVGQETLLRGIDSSSEPVRRLSLDELVRRATLTLTIAERLTADPSLPVRAIAYHALAAKGRIPGPEVVRAALKDERESSLGVYAGLFLGGASNYPDADSIITTFYSTKSTEDLLAAVDWYSLDGHLAYRALAMHRFESLAADLRSDLMTGFKRVKDDSSRRREEALGKEWEETRAAWNNLDDFIRSQFTLAAMLGLSRNAQISDAEFARPFLAQKNSPMLHPAVMVLAKAGSPEDVEALLKTAKEAYGDVATDASLAALKLSTNPQAVATEMMLSGSPGLAKTGYTWILAQDQIDALEFFKKMLSDNKEAVRLRAVHYISTRLQNAELEAILDEYLSRETYYYNVVAWLDRLLYSPSSLREAFARELGDKARKV